MKKLLPILIFSCLFFNKTHASHIMGGEITWECQSNGTFIFTMTIYRDCKGIALPTTLQTIDVYNHPSVSHIPLTFVNPSTDISAVCNNPAFQANCGVQSAQGNYLSSGTTKNGAVEEKGSFIASRTAAPEPLIEQSPLTTILTIKLILHN